ncbi:2,3,4,5-tetrahydropyridine-2,6-dicarboxylate N-acetyltransferase [compost metagenome]
MALYRRIWYVLNKPAFKDLGRNVIVRKPLIITPGFISIHNNVSINYHARIEGFRSYEGEVFTPHIILDDFCTIQQNLHLTCAGSIYIGKNTGIAANVTITDIHHPYEDINLPIERQKIKVKPVSIGDDCKIYNNSVILPGSNIGKHCTIGANSIVSGIIPDFCIVVGAPAKIIKRYCFERGEWLKTDEKGDFLK